MPYLEDSEYRQAWQELWKADRERALARDFADAFPYTKEYEKADDGLVTHHFASPRNVIHQRPTKKVDVSGGRGTLS